MFKKRAGRNIRVRKNSSDENSDSNDLGNVTNDVIIKPLKSKNPFSAVPKSNSTSKTSMSFDNDNSDDSDVCENPDWFVQKKSLANQKAAMRANEKAAAQAAAQLKFKKKEKDKVVIKREELIVETSSLKSEKPSKEIEFSIKKEDPLKDIKMEIKVEPLDRNRPETNYNNDNDSQQYDRVLNRLEHGMIPNAAEIHAARKRRQFARETASSDYVALNSRNETENPRLEQQDDMSSGDEDERMQMIGKRNDRLENRINIQETIDDHNSDSDRKANSDNDNSDSENEMSKWEKEQLEKVIGKTSLKNLTDRSSGILAQHQPKFHSSHMSYNNGASYHNPYAEVNHAAMMGYNKQGATEINLPDLPSITCSGFISDLSEKLKSLKTTHEKTEDEMRSIVRQNLEAESEIETAKKQLPEFENEFKFFQTIRNFVGDYLDCMAEKVLIIDKIEQLIHQCYMKESDYFSQRRQQEISDESLEMTLIASSGGFLNPNQVEPLHNQRIVDRCGRRQRRKLQRLNITQNVEFKNPVEDFRKLSPEFCEGLSSDEELDMNFNQSLMEEQNRIVNEENTLFEDTIDEFQDIEIVMQKLEDWKLKYPQSYDNAFVSESLPKLFSPFIKLEMLHWNPLKTSGSSLEEFTWFKLLTVFGIRSEELLTSSAENDKVDSDCLLVCKVMDRFVIPKITFFVENVWNPISVSQSYNLHSLISQLFYTYPLVNPESKRVQRLVKCILKQVDRNVSENCFVPIFSKDNILTYSPMRQFIDRQFWTCYKLAYTISLFEDIFSPATLMEKFFNGVLNQYLIMAMTNVPLDEGLMRQLDKIVDIIPKSWLEAEDIKSEVQEMQHFVRFLGQTLSHACSNSMYDSNSEAFVGHLIQLLVKVKAVDTARELISKHKLERYEHLLK